MFNFQKSMFNGLGFNTIIGYDEFEPTIVQNELTLVFDTDVVPLEYMGEQHEYSVSPWSPHRGYFPNQWHVDREQSLYFAGNDGYVYKHGVGNTDAGRPIKAHYVVPPIDLDAPDRKKRIRWIDIEADSLPGSFMRVWYRKDAEDEWSLLCEIEQGNFKYPFVSFPKFLCRKLQLKFENGYTGCSFVLNGFVLDMVIRGQRRRMV